MGWKEWIAEAVGVGVERVVTLDLNAGTVQYSDRIRKNLPIYRILEDDEIVRAYMVHRFVNVMGYAPESLELDRPYKVGEKGETVTVDVVVNDEDGNPFFFACAMAPDAFSRGDESRSRLFLAAEKEFERSGKVVRHLFYFTVKVNGERLGHESVLIDYTHFHRMSDWDRYFTADDTTLILPISSFSEIYRRNRKMIRMRYGKHLFAVFLTR